MTEHLTTSNSDQDFFDNKPWSFAILGSVFIVLVIVVLFEFNLRSRNWIRSVSDNQALWAQERERASLLGKDALILVGGSRIQLGIELDTLAKLSGKKPVQLAIDGANFYSVLKSLAEDNSITGNIIIDLHEGSIEGLTQRDKAWEWVENYQNKKKPLYLTIDHKIHNWITGFMVTKIENAKPHRVISDLILSDPKTSEDYLITHTNRSRDADYSKVKMPDFYLNRVIRYSGININVEHLSTFKEVFEAYESAIADIKATDSTLFQRNLGLLIDLIQQIEARGSEVVMIRMPTDKLIWKVDQQRYPNELFWQPIKQRHPASIHFRDHQTLNSFDLPDGSHLDKKDKLKFTQNLFMIIRQEFGI